MAPMARCVSFENSLMVSCRCERLEDGYWWKALGDFEVVRAIAQLGFVEIR